MQEVHGDSAAIARYIHGLSSSYSGTGGILLIIHKMKLQEARTPPQFSIFQDGRLLNLIAEFSSGRFSIWGFHAVAISSE